MTITYVNNLGLSEMATGDNSGTWGNVTNTNLELIGQALGHGTRVIADASQDNITMSDGTADDDRALYLKLTGGGQACTVTLLPATMSKVWIMENGTAAALTFTQGSGANVTIPAGDTKVIACTGGAGTAQIVYDVFASLSVVDLKVQDDLTVTDDVSIGGTLTVTGDTTFNGDLTVTADTVTFTSANANDPALKLINTTNDTDGAELQIRKDKGAAGADGDIVGLISFIGDDAAQQQHIFAKMTASIATAADGSEGGKLAFGVASHDAEFQNGLVLQDGNAEDEIDVTIGSGTSSLTSVAGNLDVTGNAVIDGNVGIGEATPANLLHVKASDTGIAPHASAQIVLEREGTNYLQFLTAETGTSGILFGDGSDVDVAQIKYDHNATAMSFVTEASERMRIDDSISTPTAGTSNVRLGVNAGNSIASGGNHNVLIGDEAGTALTTGDSNVAIGFQALDLEDEHGFNVAVGRSALSTLNAGANGFNVAVGYLAGDLLTTGTANVAIGTGALDNEQAGRQNVAVGYNALGTQREDSINRNTAVGYNAGAALSTAVQTTLIGHSAGSGATMTGGNNIAVGYASGNALTSGSENTFVGVEAGDGISTASSNTGIGFRSLSAAAGASNTALGIQTGLLLTGSENVLIGNVAGSAFTDADQNVAVGSGALLTDVKGDGSVAVGTSALQSQSFSSVTTTGNTALGHKAGKFVSTGQNNTFVGHEAGEGITGTRLTGDHNTVVGYEAGLTMQGACDENTILGAFAGDNLTTGSANTFLGTYTATDGTVTGNNNTCVGHAAGAALSSGDNLLLLGHDSGRSTAPGGEHNTGDDSIVLGNNSIANAYIKVDWTVTSDERDKTDFTALDLGLDFVKAMKPYTFKWDQRSDYGDSDADDYKVTDQTPDGTHKKDQLDVGFKAQDIEALEKAAGYKIDDKTNLVASLTQDETQYGLKYSKFVPILVKAIQEQNALIEALTARVATLEG